MNKLLFSSLILGAKNFFKVLNQEPSSAPNIDRMKMTLLYVKGIKTMRMLFLSFLGVGICVVFLMVGLILFNMTLFTYTLLDMQTKMYVGFGLSFVYLFIASAIFQYVFSQDNWLVMFNAKELMKDLRGSEENMEKTA